MRVLGCGIVGLCGVLRVFGWMVLGLRVWGC